MKKKIYMATRWLLAAFLLWGVYLETGIYTTAFAVIVFIGTEAHDVLIKRLLAFKSHTEAKQLKEGEIEK